MYIYNYYNVIIVYNFNSTVHGYIIMMLKIITNLDSSYVCMCLGCQLVTWHLIHYLMQTTQVNSDGLH